MQYYIQSDYGKGWEHAAFIKAGYSFSDKDKAIECVKKNANLARMIRPIMAISESGEVVAFYDPERDIRLPGCRERAIERNAYKLWDKAGRPEGKDVEFWLQAEKDLPEHDGLFFPNATIKYVGASGMPIGMVI